MRKEHWALVIGYLIGSFFGITQLLGLFGGVNKAAQSWSKDPGSTWGGSLGRKVQRCRSVSS